MQILGAEKALFRALKTKGNTPKYGLIYHSSFIGRAGAKNKGRISRYVANKASIASRIDCFSETPTDKFGLELKKQVDERLSFYETGEAPRKNLDVMREVASAMETEDGAAVPPVTPSSEKKKKKKNKRPADEMDTPTGKATGALLTFSGSCSLPLKAFVSFDLFVRRLLFCLLGGFYNNAMFHSMFRMNRNYGS